MRRKRRARGRFGRPLIEIEYAQTDPGTVPIALLPEGATQEDADAVKAWLRAVRSDRGGSVDLFVRADADS